MVVSSENQQPFRSTYNLYFNTQRHKGYPELHDSLDVVEHLGDVGEAGQAVVGAVVAAHDPGASSALPRVSLHKKQRKTKSTNMI